MVDMFYAPWPHHTHIDAGIVPTVPEETIRIPVEERLEASREDLDTLNSLPLYANQEVHLEENITTGDLRVVIRYLTPCITTLRAA